MTNCNKINFNQKSTLAEYMQQHPNLAKNLLPNTAQGKANASRLWETLARKLNGVGPPVKTSKAWKKVYADQKFQAKRKLSFNKLSRSKTGGGPYEEKVLSQVDELIIEASGLEAAVEGLLNVKSFGGLETPVDDPEEHDFHQQMEILSVISDSENREPMEDEDDVEEIFTPTETQKPPKRISKKDVKISLMEEHNAMGNKFQEEINKKLEILLEIQKRLLQIKEEQHKIYMENQKMDIQIKTLRLELLRENCKDIK